jgi:hypothetical protein
MFAVDKRSSLFFRRTKQKTEKPKLMRLTAVANVIKLLLSYFDMILQ